jgi:hypothetical protein
MIRSRWGALLVATLAAATLGVTSMQSAAVSDDGLTAEYCAELGGEYTTSKSKETCRIKTTITFRYVEEHRSGGVEPMESTDGWSYIDFTGGWQSAQDVEFTRTLSQVKDRAVVDQTSSEVLDYYDYEYATCMSWVYDADGARLGGGLEYYNAPCKERGLMPQSAPDIMMEPTW